MHEKYDDLVYRKPWRRTKKKNQWTIHMISKRKYQKPFRINWIQSIRSLDHHEIVYEISKIILSHTETTTVKSSYRQHVKTCCAYFCFQWGTRHREEYFRNILSSTRKLKKKKKHLEQSDLNESNKKFESKLSIQVMVKNQWPWMYGYVCELTGWKTVCENQTSSEHTCRPSAPSTSGIENEGSSKRRLVLFCTRKRALTRRRREYCVDRKSRDADRCRVIATNARFPNSQGRQYKMQIENETFRINPRDDIRLGSPTFLECVRVLMGEGVQGLIIFSGFLE